MISTKSKRWVIFTISIILLLFWQISFTTKNNETEYKNKAAVGLYKQYDSFFYFFHHTGYFPIYSKLRQNTKHTKSAALRIIKKKPKAVSMEVKHVIRSGENGKIFLYLPESLYKGSKATPKLFYIILFVASLLALFTTLYYSGNYLLAYLSVIFLGSNPFQLFAVYQSKNIFSLFISTYILLVSVNFFFLQKRPQKLLYYILVPLLSGVFLGFIRDIRSEPFLIASSILFLYLFFSKIQLKRRAVLIACLFLSIAATQVTLKKYWKNQYKRTTKFLTSKGITPMPDNISQSHHELWHPLLCGLGDYDTKYGYKWDDLAIFKMISPIMNSKYDFNWPFGQRYNGSYDKKGKYLIKIGDFKEYHIIAKDLFFKAVLNDVSWYFNIIKKRVIRIFSEGTPLTINLSVIDISFKVPGLLVLLSIVLMVIFRHWPWLIIFTSSLPLIAPALLIFSGKGNHFYGISHLISSSYLLFLLWTECKRYLSKSRGLLNFKKKKFSLSFF